MDLAEIQKQAKQAVSEIVEASLLKPFTRGSMKFWSKSGSSWPPSAAST